MKNIPSIGYGTWNRPEDTAYQGVKAAIEAGYRHLDCAEGYENEEYVGRAIADAGLPRDDLWVTTKVAPESFAPGQIRTHVEASLEKLGVGPVDLLLLHYPSINDEYDIEDYDYCTTHDIRMTAYSPLARGAVLEDPTLNGIAQAVGGTAPQVALAWLLAKGYIVIPSAGSPARIQENLGAGELKLSPEQVAEIDGLNSDMRLVDGPWCPAWDTE